MDSSGAGDSSTPLADITNKINHGVLDRNERRRQRYASMPKEQKDELNRKKRDRRLENKRQANENITCDGSGLLNIGANQGNHSHAASNCEHTILQTAKDKGVSVTIDEDEERLHRGHLTRNNDLPGVSVSINEDENNEWLHKGQLTQTNDDPGVSVSINEDEDSEWLHKGQLTQINDQPVGCEISISVETNDDCIHDIGIESTIAQGDLSFDPEDAGDTDFDPSNYDDHTELLKTDWAYHILCKNIRGEGRTTFSTLLVHLKKKLQLQLQLTEEELGLYNMSVIDGEEENEDLAELWRKLKEWVPPKPKPELPEVELHDCSLFSVPWVSEI